MIADGISAPLHPGAERTTANGLDPVIRGLTRGGPHRAALHHDQRTTRCIAGGAVMSDDDKTRERQQQASAVEMQPSGHGALTQEELDELVASSDTGARSPAGFRRRADPGGGPVLVAVPAVDRLAAALHAGFGVFNDTDARSIHLAFALFLAFMAYPAAQSPFQLALGVVGSGDPVRAVHLRREGRRRRSGGSRWSALASSRPCCWARPRPAFRPGNGRWRWSAWSSRMYVFVN